MANSKRVAVTGALGKIGKVLVPDLRDKGYEVFLIDDIAPSDPKESAILADLTDFGQALDALSSIGADTYARAEPKAFDAIVHLASMPHPRMKPDAEELRINMMATYNVFESARRLGIKKCHLERERGRHRHTIRQDRRSLCARRRSLSDARLQRLFAD